jgi:hypothetical protein
MNYIKCVKLSRDLHPVTYKNTFIHAGATMPVILLSNAIKGLLLICYVLVLRDIELYYNIISVSFF